MDVCTPVSFPDVMSWRDSVRLGGVGVRFVRLALTEKSGRGEQEEDDGNGLGVFPGPWLP